ncbi:MAG: ABC transporter substrate-binding protein [Corynebacterium sp.]|uniref:ABC transporter substrate-binding protein n=1 Tax=Corynebacterium sp. TaxID=1720 RepID=UPI003F9DC894
MVLEPVQLDTSIALGVVPVGAAVLNEEQGIPDYLREVEGLDDRTAKEIDAIGSVGTVAEPDLERIAALEPDLILGTKSRHAALMDQLTDIAPTKFMASQADPWRDNAAFTAEALGLSQEADGLMADYDARCDEVSNVVREQGSGDGPPTGQLIRPRDDLFTLYGPLSFAGSTLECAGFTIPEQDWEDISLDVSEENIGQAGADLIVVTATDASDPAQMPADIDGADDSIAGTYGIHLVDQSLWISGVGPLGGQAVLDELEKLVD